MRKKTGSFDKPAEPEMRQQLVLQLVLRTRRQTALRAAPPGSPARSGQLRSGLHNDTVSARTYPSYSNFYHYCCTELQTQFPSGTGIG